MKDDVLIHYGMPRRSGRYPWGSGENPYQRTSLFKGWVNDLKGKGKSAKEIYDEASTLGLEKTIILYSLKDAGYSEKEIMSAMGIGTERYRAIKSLASEEDKAERDALVWHYRNDYQMSPTAIGKKMNLNESTIRGILDKKEASEKKGNIAIAEALKESLAKSEGGMLDVGKGSEELIGVSRTRLKNALNILEEQGYKVQSSYIEQVFTGNRTPLLVLTDGDKTPAYIKKNRDKITPLGDFYSEDGGEDIFKVKPPTSLDSSRIMVKFAEDGGTDKDGVIELRRNVPDLSLGNSNYAQVRIKVDGTHYLKGMAMYSDDIPEGYDVIFNTNKHKGTPLMDDDPKASQVFKPLKTTDPNSTDPFGAVIKAGGQSEYTDKDGNKKLSPINKLMEEGDWSAWSKTLASQMLSKQPLSLAKRQLNEAYQDSLEEYNDILSITNPVVKQKLLAEFADGCDSDAVELKAKALPGQASHVLLPIPSMSSTEVYAPNYENGDKVVLIRYPHAGKFEIPELIVNNKNKEAEKVIGNTARDAIGINPVVAAQLSGADFDGDTVLVIPNNKGLIKTEKVKNELVNFNPKDSFPYYEGMRVMKAREKQMEMGKITNLITDMTLQGAGDDEIVRAVKHSMVVIDAEKHKLDYKTSEKVFNIQELKDKYQGIYNEETKRINYGAATLISRASSELTIPKRKLKNVSEMTPDELSRYKEGEKIYKDAGYTYPSRKIDKKTGEVIWEQKEKTEKVSKMSMVKDARDLIGKNAEIEYIYADYANKMKALALNARKESLITGKIQYDPSAAKIYKEEVNQLKADSALANRNKPRERMAQIYANYKIRAIREDNPNLYLDKDKLKKVKANILAEGRAKYNAKKAPVIISPRQWEAINAGAITTSALKDIIDNISSDTLKTMAMPKKDNVALSQKDIALIKNLNNRGYTTAEIAKKLGISASTVSKSLK